jgi:hypothetical protein
VVQPVKKISFPEKRIDLAPGTHAQLRASVEPDTATVRELIWFSSNEKVATVDSNGKVTGVSKGNAKVTAAAADGSGVKAQISVQVKWYDLVFSSILPQKLNYINTNAGLGKDKIRASVQKGNVRISSADESRTVFRMDNTSLEEIEVTPLKPGTDVITIQLSNGRTNFTVYVAEDFDDYAVQYVALPDTSPKYANGSLRNVIYGTPYSEIKDQLIEQYGNNCEITDEGTGFSITFNNPGINVAGHDVRSLSFVFCYDEDRNGYITRDEATTSFIRAVYVFMDENSELAAEDLYSQLEEMYGKADREYGSFPFYFWSNNQTVIYLYRSASLSLTYSWSTGASKAKKLQEIYDYQTEMEKRKTEESEQSESGGSADVLDLVLPSR